MSSNEKNDPIKAIATTEQLLLQGVERAQNALERLAKDNLNDTVNRLKVSSQHAVERIREARNGLYCAVADVLNELSGFTDDLLLSCTQNEEVYLDAQGRVIECAIVPSFPPLNGSNVYSETIDTGMEETSKPKKRNVRKKEEDK